MSDLAWDTSCLDWQGRIMAGRSLVPDLSLYEESAALGLRIFKRLRIPDIIGTPTNGEACGPWMFPIVEAIFGSLDPDTFVRAISEFFLLIPKKNGKSSTAAAIMVVALIVNRRPSGEFLLIAPTKEIADISFRQASGIIRADPELIKLFHIQRHLRLITHRRTEATLQIKAADTDVITGSKAVGTLIDETHVFARRSRAAEVFVELRGALAARPDGFLIQITTQSKDTPSGVFKQELKTARNVRDGLIKLPLLPIMYEIPIEITDRGGWKNRTFWPLVNPNLGRSVSFDFLDREDRKSEGDPAAEALFASQHFNVEIGQALLSDRWSGAEFWADATDPEITLDWMMEHCEVITAGIDGGGLDDLFALAFVGRIKNSQKWVSWCRAWCHIKVLATRKSEAPKLRDFERDGDLVIISEIGPDVIEAVALIKTVDRRNLLAGVGLDPHGIGDVVTALAGEDIEGEDRVFGIPQGYRLMGAIKTSERMLAQGTLRHADQPLAAWAVGNAKIELKGNAVLITKQAAGTAKIDPLMALLNAVFLMARNPESMIAAYSGTSEMLVF